MIKPEFADKSYLIESFETTEAMLNRAREWRSNQSYEAQGLPASYLAQQYASEAGVTAIEATACMKKIA